MSENTPEESPELPEEILGQSTFANKPRDNICFLNTSLQSLFHILPLSKILIDISNEFETPPTDDPKQEMLSSYITLLRAYWEENCCISPDTFLSIFAKMFPDYRLGEQADASESLLFIVDQLHEALAAPETNTPSPPQAITITTPTTNARFSASNLARLRQKAQEHWNGYYKERTSPILKYLVGEQHQRSQCLKCKKINHTFVPFSHICLPLIPNKNNLIELIDAYTDKEQLDHENQLQCDNCHRKSRGYRKTIFWTLPEYLIIVLKRFTQTHTGHYVKNRAPIDFPLENLDLTPYLSDPDNHPPAKYSLQSIGIHQGAHFFGHYWALVRGLDNQFAIYDDDQDVRPVTPEYITKLQSYAYFFVYCRTNSSAD